MFLWQFKRILKSSLKQVWWLRKVKFVALAMTTLLLVTSFVPAVAQNDLPQQNQIVQTNLLQQGKQLYQGGRLAEAVDVWQEARNNYQQTGAIFNQVQALNYLTLVYQDLGKWTEAQEAIAISLELLQSQSNLTSKGLALLAQTLNNQGSWQLARGQTELALETWKQATTIYEEAGSEQGRLGSQINQAQAMQVLGQHRQAQTLLEEIYQQLQSQPDSHLKADGLRSLGRTLQTVGDLRQAKAILEESWHISESINATDDIGATIFSLANIARDLKQYQVALDYYQEVVRVAPDPMIVLQSQLNQLSLLIAQNRGNEATSLISSIQSQFSNLSPSRALIYARINLAESLMKLSSQGPYSSQVAKLLAQGIQEAKQLQDSRAEAAALNQLGKLYGQKQQWSESAQVTQQALYIAQTINADDLVARSSWQLGKALDKENEIDQAIAAYQEAWETLQKLRGDLVSVNSDIQFDFQESVEPVYRELVSLLLQADDNQDNLQQARQVIEALQLAEIEDFFQEACLQARPVELESLDAKAAVIYPIILPDRLEVILSLPDQPLKHYATQLTSDQVNRVLQKLYSSFYLGYSNDERLKLAQQVYSWLIQSAEEDLASNNIQTLVFVLDGFLRSLPMNALYDGKQYLIEKYSIALSPGLQLLPQARSRAKLQALTAGLTEARAGFPPLPGVAVEVEQISADLNRAKVLLDKDFTRPAFQNQVQGKDFGIVHLATHGQFSSDPEQTFLLTWDDRIKVRDFARLFQEKGQGSKPVELLVLSACQTAAGDRRAALGLAGFALRSGALSTVATLWSVNDQSTAELMSEFYQQLTQVDANLTKAESLRQAQLKLLKNPLYSHPYYWAPFVLVGNWL